MKKILIVGASSSGLILAHQLLRAGYDVTVINSPASGEIRTGPLPLFQFTLGEAVARERALDLTMWEGMAPHITGVDLLLHPPQGDPAAVRGRFAAPGVSVDHRIKMADWLESFEDRGGKVVIHGVTVTDLDYFTRMFHLIVVAVGGGELGQLFDHNSDIARAKERTVAQVLIDDVPPGPYASSGGDLALVGSAREVRGILAPVLTTQGECHILQLVSNPGGPMDSWPDRPGPDEQLRRAKEIVGRYFPDMYERIVHAQLIGERSTSTHRISPHARRAIAQLPSGGHVLGLGDMVVTTDPMAAQESNLSVHSAQHYYKRILDHGDQGFTPEWMQETFDGFWSGQDGAHTGMGAAASGLSEMLDGMWEPDAPAHVGEVFGAATFHQPVADRIIEGLADPRSYAEWLMDPEQARAYLASVLPQALPVS